MWTWLRRRLRAILTCVRRDNLPKIALLIIIVIATSTSGLAIFESVPLSNALWWSVVTVTTVGYGDITPVTIGGRILGAITMLAGIGLLGILTASLASLMVGMKLEGIRGMQAVDCSNHLVICGWNHKAREILDELHADALIEETPAVLIADLPEAPVESHNVFFVRGEVTLSTIELAKMGSAKAAIVLGDEHLDAFSRDARTILTTLTIKTAYPDLYTCVELVDAKNISHCYLAKADEVIVSGALTSNLLVRAALDHGVTRVVTELLNSHGHELYLTPTPVSIVGLTFLEALHVFKEQRDALIIAIHNLNGEVQTNPDAGYRLKEDDRLYLIAEQRPCFT